MSAFPVYAGQVSYGYETVDGLQIFYREAGNPAKPALVLLHGFPASSHQYREVLEQLGDDYYLIAPDYPGFGYSSFPSPQEFKYSFDNLANVMDKFLDKKGLTKYSIMIQDYGSPVGFRIATAHPERIQAIITQNGNAYIEGIGVEGWGPVVDYWKTKTPELEKKIINAVLSYDGIKSQFVYDTKRAETMAPDVWELAYAKIARPGQARVQLDLLYDYQNNLKKYPEWQAYLKKHQPPVLVVWGKHDPFFLEAGAAAFKKDVKDIDYNIYDAGHFALEEKSEEITVKIRKFLSARGIK
ncbi:MAG: hydrolase [Cellvibrio sp. 79]|nr:MAG: hydrolase [Cellvibrio sp. 79]